jgi:predicted nucleic acid-binding Zn ribbon protein
LLSELLEEYKTAENKQKIIDEFTNLLWSSKYTLKKHKKVYSYEIDKEVFRNRQDLIELFNQYKLIEFTFCKSYYKKRLDYIDYIRVHVNNMYAYLVDTTVYLPKEYYQLLLTPKKEYFKILSMLKNDEEVNYEDIKYKIEFALMEAEEIKTQALQNKINLKWPEYKKLINSYIERIFNNYISPAEYESEHGWEMKTHNVGWNENNYIVKYFCKSLTGYLRHYIRDSKPKEFKKKYCVVCGTEIENTGNRKKYCDDCWKKRQRELWRKNKQKKRNVQV